MTGCLKCINSLPKKVCFVVVWNSSQLPEQKESLFSQESRTSSTTLTKLNLSLAQLSLSPSLLYLYKYKDMSQLSCRAGDDMTPCCGTLIDFSVHFWKMAYIREEVSCVIKQIRHSCLIHTSCNTWFGKCAGLNRTSPAQCVGIELSEGIFSKPLDS